VNAKSIMGVMMLAAPRARPSSSRTDGADEEAAMAAIEKLFADKFGEAE
jgi:phosphocarrier protein